MSGIITGSYFRKYFNEPTALELGSMVAILEVGAFGVFSSALFWWKDLIVYQPRLLLLVESGIYMAARAHFSRAPSYSLSAAQFRLLRRDSGA